MATAVDKHTPKEIPRPGPYGTNDPSRVNMWSNSGYEYQGYKIKKPITNIGIDGMPTVSNMYYIYLWNGDEEVLALYPLDGGYTQAIQAERAIDAHLKRIADGASLVDETKRREASRKRIQTNQVKADKLVKDYTKGLDDLAYDL